MELRNAALNGDGVYVQAGRGRRNRQGLAGHLGTARGLAGHLGAAALVGLSGRWLEFGTTPFTGFLPRALIRSERAGSAQLGGVRRRGMTGIWEGSLGGAMDRWVKRDSAVALGLVMCGVLARLACRDVPNFAPVAGLALFAGYYLRSWRLAVLVPWAIMLISDQFLGGYDWKLQLVVYSLLALPVFARGMLQRLLNDAPTSTGPANFAAGGASESSTGRNESSVAGASRDVSGRLAAGHWGAVSRSALRSSLVITGASVTGSVVFFLGSNIAVWALASWYPHTWQGLSSCLINALPFFQYTLAGDLFFSWSAFAILAGAQAWSAARSCVTRHSF